MITPRERFLRTFDFEPVDGAFTFLFGAWQQTADLWKTQGWDGQPIEKLFDIDVLQQVGVYYGPAPAFSYEVIEEAEQTRTYVNHEGIVMREFKEHAETSMPQFLKFPVNTREEFETLASQRLSVNKPVRFTDEWKSKTGTWAHSGWPRMCWADRWGGFFGPLRNLMGVENLCLAFYDQPALVERMMEQRADAIIEITREVMRHTAFEVFWLWEDMAYNHGPLIGPKLYRRFALKHYRRVCDWLRAHGVKHIGLDSDGDIRQLIPIWLDAGINALWPFEVQSGMDVVCMRRIYGNGLVMVGGIDKRVLIEGGDAMRREVDRIVPLVAEGGYVPTLDHSVPPDVSWANFCEFVSYLVHRLGRG
jgi:hypothetical protein